MKYRINIFLFSLIISTLLFGCNNYENSSINKMIIIDSIGNTSSNMLAESNGVNIENYEINYIGVKKDTIYINPNFRITPPPPSPPLPELSKGLRDTLELISKNYQRKKNNIDKHIFNIKDIENIRTIYYDTISIFVDTTQIISKNNYKAYPVIIENIKSDTLIIGNSYSDRISGELEAIFPDGKWRAITDNYWHGLPVDYQIILLKNEIIITSLFVYDGEYKTRLRFRVGKNYSNEFISNISYKQINKRNYY